MTFFTAGLAAADIAALRRTCWPATHLAPWNLVIVYTGPAKTGAALTAALMRWIPENADAALREAARAAAQEAGCHG